MSKEFGAHRTVVGAHYGLRDWLWQRGTAVAMALFTVLVLIQLLRPGPLDYARWQALFMPLWMRLIVCTVFIGSLVHAWVGARDIAMDYLRPTWLRLLVEGLVICWLLFCGAWFLHVLWRI